MTQTIYVITDDDPTHGRLANAYRAKREFYVGTDMGDPNSLLCDEMFTTYINA